LYKSKGKEIRESVDDVMANNERQLIDMLKIIMDNELKTMTPSKGRQLLNEASVMIFPSLDINSSLVFDSFLHNTNGKYKLILEDVTEVYMGTKYNNNENSLMIWALYPPHKKTTIIDIEKTFGHVMTLKVGETDPLITIDIGINVAKLNKA